MCASCRALTCGLLLLRFSLRRVQRLLDLIVPDFVHVMIEGKIVQTGGKARTRSHAASQHVLRVSTAASLTFARALALSPARAAQELAAQLELSGYAEMGR